MTPHVRLEPRELHRDELLQFAGRRQLRRAGVRLEQPDFLVAHRLSLPTGTLGVGKPIGEPKICDAHHALGPAALPRGHRCEGVFLTQVAEDQRNRMPHGEIFGLETAGQGGGHGLNFNDVGQRAAKVRRAHLPPSGPVQDRIPRETINFRSHHPLDHASRHPAMPAGPQRRPDTNSRLRPCVPRSSADWP